MSPEEVEILRLRARIEAIEARQRSYGLHDPHCPVRQTEIRQRSTMAYLMSPECNCWLSN